MEIQNHKMQSETTDTSMTNSDYRETASFPETLHLSVDYCLSLKHLWSHLAFGDFGFPYDTASVIKKIQNRKMQKQHVFRHATWGLSQVPFWMRVNSNKPMKEHTVPPMTHTCIIWWLWPWNRYKIMQFITTITYDRMIKFI